MFDMVLRAGESFAKQVGKDGANQCGYAESEEVDRASGTPFNLVWIDFLHDRVRNHRRAGGDSKNQAGYLSRLVVGTESDCGRGHQHHGRAADEYRLAAADPIREPSEQGTPDYPSQWNQGTCDNCIVVAEHPVALKEGHAPGH